MMDHLDRLRVRSFDHVSLLCQAAASQLEMAVGIGHDALFHDVRRQGRSEPGRCAQWAGEVGNGRAQLNWAALHQTERSLLVYVR